MRLILLAIALGASAVAAGAPAHADDGEPWRLQQAVGAPEWLILRGSARARYEALDGQFRAGQDGGDQLLSSRVLLYGEARSGPLRVAAELQDARAALGDPGGSISTGEVNTLEFIQAHVGATFDDVLVPGSRTDLVFGRFTLDLGSRRLAAVNTGPNTTTAFAGARLSFAPSKADRLVLFHSRPLVRLPDDVPSLLDNAYEADEASGDLRFSGAFYARSGLPAGSTGEMYIYDLEERDAADRPTRNRNLLTVGGRLHGEPRPGAFDYEVEAAVQTGSARASTRATDVRDLEVEASFAHLEVGRTLDAPGRPRVSLEYDYASGDAREGDDASGRFDALFGSRSGDFGPSGLYGPLARANLSAPGVRVDVTPDKRLDGFLAYRLLYLAEPRDSFAGTGLRDPSGASGRFAGQQVLGQARYWLVPDSLRLELGAAALINGGFMERAPNRTGEGDTLFGYADLTFSF